MNILSLKCNNMFMFKNFYVDFTYRKKISHFLGERDALFPGSSIHVRKNIVVLGGNASGKSTFGCLLRLVAKGLSGSFSNDLSELEAVRFNKDKTAWLEVEFLIEKFVFRWFFEYNESCVVDEYISFCCPHEKDTITVVRSILDGKYRKDEETTGKFSVSEDGKFYGQFLQGLNLCGLIFHENNWIKFSIFEKGSRIFVAPLTAGNGYNFHVTRLSVQMYDKFLPKVDVSIKKVTALLTTAQKEQGDALRLEFANGESMSLAKGKNGRWVNVDRLSSGTQEALAFFEMIAEIASPNEMCVYVDEQLAHLHVELEQYLVYKAVLLNKNQVFFTTHNQELLDLNLPNNAFLLFRRDKNGYNSAFFADKFMKKNDRSLRNYYENDYFGVLPDYTSLDTFFKEAYGHV